MSLSTRAFIIACLCSHHDEQLGLTAETAIAQNMVDWNAVVEMASEEHVLPALHPIFQGMANVPDEVLCVTRRAHGHTALRNMFLMHACQQVEMALSSADISSLALKGAALVRTVYASLAVRSMHDIDLLIRHSDAKHARDILEAMGYLAADPETHPDMTWQYENECLLVKPGTIEIPLELHWSLFDSPHYQQHMDMNWFWQTAETRQFNGAAMTLLGLEAELLHLCAHMVLHHTGNELFWLNDIVTLIHHETERVDWQLLLAKAAEFDLVIPLQQLLPVLAADWAAPIPLPVLDQLKGLNPSTAEVHLVADLALPQRPVIVRFWTDLKSMKGWRQRAHYALGHIFPSRAYMRERYAIPHAILLPVAYPYRWGLGLAGLHSRRQNSGDSHVLPG